MKKEENSFINIELEQTLIFSLDLNKKFDMKNSKNNAIKYNTGFGPIFGDKDIALNENMKKGITFANENWNLLSNYNLEITGGKGEKETFDTEEIEIFKIIYE